MAALMGRTAAHSGKYITWDQVMKSNFQFISDIDNITMETKAPVHDGPDGIYAAPMPGITKEI